MVYYKKSNIHNKRKRTKRFRYGGVVSSIRGRESSQTDLIGILGKDSIETMCKSINDQYLDDFIEDALSPNAANSIVSFDQITVFEPGETYEVDTQLGSGKSGAILLRLKSDNGKTCILKIYDITSPREIPYSKHIIDEEFEVHKQNPFNKRYFRAMKDIAINTIVSTRGFSPRIKGYGLVDFPSIYPIVKEQMESRIEKQKGRVFKSHEKIILSALNRILETQNQGIGLCYPFLIMEELEGYDLLGGINWINNMFGGMAGMGSIYLNNKNVETKMFIMLFILYRIAFIMDSLKSIGLCHRDLHPGNVWITINEELLTDENILDGQQLANKIESLIIKRQRARARELRDDNPDWRSYRFVLSEPIENLEVYDFLLSVFTIKIIDFDLSKLSAVSGTPVGSTLMELVGADSKDGCTRVYTIPDKFKGNWIRGTNKVRRSVNLFSMRAPPARMRQNADLNAWANMYITLLDQFPFKYPRLSENIDSFADCVKYINDIFIKTIGVCKVVLDKDDPNNATMFFDRPIRHNGNKRSQGRTRRGERERERERR